MEIPEKSCATEVEPLQSVVQRLSVLLSPSSFLLPLTPPPAPPHRSLPSQRLASCPHPSCPSLLFLRVAITAQLDLCPTIHLSGLLPVAAQCSLCKGKKSAEALKEENRQLRAELLHADGIIEDLEAELGDLGAQLYRLKVWGEGGGMERGGGVGGRGSGMGRERREIEGRRDRDDGLLTMGRVDRVPLGA